eukprot:Skav232893  [mRNA]  locus=scaffold4134:99876:101456:- [translate_table: standard]
MPCRRSFRTKAGLHAHLCKAHGRVAAVRFLFDGTACPHCLKEYHVATKLHNHLVHSHICRLQLIQRGLHCDPIPGRGSRAAQSQQAQHDGLAPIAQGSGPWPSLGRPIQETEVVADLELRVLNYFLESDVEATDEHLTVGLIACVNAYVVTFQELVATFSHMVINFQEDTATDMALPVTRVSSLLSLLCDADWWRFRWGSVNDVSTTSVGPSSFHASNCALWDASSVATPSLRSFPRERIVLHLFSGRRRAGDLQQYLERLHADLPLSFLTVVSVDIICNEEWGDISKPHVRLFWLQALRQGWVVALLAGPPCETWSRARSQHLESHEGRGPRPVRDALALWGFSALRVRECLQVALGNTLLCFCLEALVSLFLSGGLGVLEHPSCPDDDDGAASIWRLPLMQFLLKLPGFAISHVQQGRLGAPSAKPTTLLTLNVNDMDLFLQQWYISGPPYPETSIGLGTDGQFKTQRLKEYPPAMCAGLSSALVHALEERHIAAASSLPADFMSRCKAMQCDFTHFIGRDFAG